MIKSFADDRTETIWNGKTPKGVPVELARKALQRLTLLDSAARLEDLYVPPSNKFHALKSTRLYAISVNKQWRIVFGWDGVGATEVRFMDYH